MTALLVALGGAGYSATGGSFILGQSNTASTQTRLTSPLAGTMFRLENTSTAVGSTALGLFVTPGRTPFTVNSNVRVGNLNADLLDGRHADGLLRVARNQVNDAGSGATFGDEVTVTLTAPSAGFVLVTGTISVGTSDGTCNPCYLHQRLRDGNGNFSFPNFVSVGNGTGNITRSIATNTWVFPVAAAGSQTYGLQTGVSDSDIYAENPTITALFVPFGPTGTLTGITSVSSASEAPRLGRVERDGSRKVLH